MGLRTAWLLGVLVLGGIALSAQEKKPGDSSEFKATVDVRVVNIEAVATDSKGRPVHGLTAADFRMTADGREVPIDYFTEVSEGEEVAGRPDATASPTPAKVGTSYLIFIDNVFSIDAQRNRVLDRLEQDLRLGPEDRVAIVSYFGRPQLLSGWTGNMQRVHEIFNQVRKTPTAPVYTFWNQDVELAQVAASVAMRGLPPQPGRKLFLLVSGGWPKLVAHSEIKPGEISPLVSEVPLEKLFEPVADTANLLGYTIYFLEVPGFGSDLSVIPTWQHRPSGRFNLVDLGENLSPYANLWKLARRTGGTAVLFSSKGSLVERLERDSRSYYSMAFSPDWQADGKRHRVTVKARKSGIRVQSRDGYFDMTPNLHATLKAESLLMFGSSSTIQATAGKPRWGGLGAINLPVTLAIPARLLTARPVAGGYELRATIFSRSNDDWGGGEQHPDVPLVLTLPKAPGPDDVIPFTVTLNLSTLGQQLSFTVLDDAGGGVARAALNWNHKEKKSKEPKEEHKG